MPQLIGLVLVGAGLWAGVKAIQRIAERMADAGPAPDGPDAATPEKDLGRLEPDPETGVYRPAAVDGRRCEAG